MPHVLSHIPIPIMYVVPPLYRYENTEYIDDFFINGKILISSFKRYRSYTDNELGDASEGDIWSRTIGDNGKISSMQFGTAGFENCFCTSTLLDEELKSKFSRNDVFRIIDPLNFIREITRSLERVVDVLYGNCIYVERRVREKRVPFVDTSFPPVIDLYDTPYIPPDQYFYKLLKHQSQSEYRIIWRTDRNTERDVILYCPEAVKFCERITPKEEEKPETP